MRLVACLCLAAAALAADLSAADETPNEPRPLLSRFSKPARRRDIVPELAFRKGRSRFNSGRHSSEKNNETAISLEQQSKPKQNLITEPMPGQEFVTIGKGTPRSSLLPLKADSTANEDTQIYITTEPTSLAEPIPEPEAEPVPEPEAEPVPEPEVEPLPQTHVSEDTNEAFIEKLVESTAAYEDTTDSPSYFIEEQSDIDILSPKNNFVPSGLAVNQLYGKHFDERDLDFGKGLNDDDKLLVPAESRVKSKFEIKEVNGQLYEYEYRYYYDDELPQYDYDVVGNIPDIPIEETATVKPATPKPTVETTASIRTTKTSQAPQQQTVSSRSRSRGSSSFSLPDQSRLPVQPERTSSRGRNTASQTGDSSRASSRGRNTQASAGSQGVDSSRRSSTRGTRTKETITNANNENNVLLPSQTRFPPRSSTPTTTPKIIELPVTEFDDIQTEQNFDETDEVTTMSPATKSLMNLFALSQIEEVEEDTTTIATEVDTTIPEYYNLDDFYNYDYGLDNNSYLDYLNTELPDVKVVSTTTSTTTPTPRTTTTSTTTTSTTTTTTTTTAKPSSTTLTSRVRSRGNTRNILRGQTNRLASRHRNTQKNNLSPRKPQTAPANEIVDENVDVVTQSAVTTTSTRSPPRRGSNRASLSSLRGTRFRPSSRKQTTATKPQIQSESETPSNVTTTESITTTTTTAPKTTRGRRPNKFNRPRPSFRSRTNAEPKTTERPTAAATTAASRSRGRLFNRLTRGRKQKKEPKKPIEDVIPDITEMDEVANATLPEAVAEPTTTTTTLPPTSAKTTPSRRGSFGRGRLNTRFRNSRRRTTVAPTAEPSPSPEQEEASIAADSTVSVEPTSTTSTTSAPRRSNRKRPSRLSARFNSRKRGKGRSESTKASATTTTTTLEPPADNEIEPKEIVEDTPDTIEPTVEEEQPVKSDNKRGGKRPPKRKGSVFGRFRNRSRSNSSPEPKTTTTAAPATKRRSSFGLSQRRRRPNHKAEEIVEKVEEDLESDVSLPGSEVLDNFIAESTGNGPDAHGPQVELEPQASEDVVAVVEPVAEEVPKEEEEVPEDAKPAVVKKSTKPSKGPKRGLSLLARLRQRNRPARS